LGDRAALEEMRHSAGEPPRASAARDGCASLTVVNIAVGMTARPTPFGGFAAWLLTRSNRGGGARTPDLRFWRPPLYQLSYAPLMPGLYCGVVMPVWTRQKAGHRSLEAGALPVERRPWVGADCIGAFRASLSNTLRVCSGVRSGSSSPCSRSSSRRRRLPRSSAPAAARKDGSSRSARWLSGPGWARSRCPHFAPPEEKGGAHRILPS
jgi:hypothetical protein